MSSVVNTVVLYHRGCADGIVAAWCARECFGSGAEYHPYQYGDVLPNKLAGKHLVFVDLSLKAEQLHGLMLDPLTAPKSVLIVDHHATAEKLREVSIPMDSLSGYMSAREDMELTNRVFLRWDSKRSGAALAWLFFNGLWPHEANDIALPYAILRIEDYDLWKHQYPESRAITTWLVNGGLDIERANQLMTADSTGLMAIVKVGELFLNYDRRIVRSVTRDYVEELKFGKTRIALINAPHHLRNEIGDTLAEQFDIVACYTRRTHRTVVSMRSTQVDVSKIAEVFGGGGHKSSAAFSVSNDHTPRQIFTDLFTPPPVSMWQRIKGWFRGLQHDNQ